MRLTGTTRLAAVIGSPVRHSLSPVVHNAAFAALGLDWAYVAFEVAPGDCRRALDGMRALGLGGLSVTTPHKDDVAALVDEASSDVQALGAANCVVPVAGGRLRGENTDGPGFVAALRESGVEPAGLRCCVLGAGGAARSIVLALARAGAARVDVVNRTAAKAEAAARLAGGVGAVASPEAVADADVVVNATSIGMGDDRRLPLDPGRLADGQVVAEVVVFPVETALLAAARERGCATVDGVGMLVHQAAIAFELWTGQAPPVQVMSRAARAALAGAR